MKRSLGLVGEANFGAWAFVALMLFFLPIAHATTGQNDGEKILDSSSNFQSTAYSSQIDQGNYYQPGSVQNVQSSSTLINNLVAQFANKEQAQNQNVQTSVSQDNLAKSKESVSTMFFFIVATFVVLFDMIISIIYIVLLMIVIWVVFVGYAKLLIMIINWISGKLSNRKMKL